MLHNLAALLANLGNSMQTVHLNTSVTIWDWRLWVWPSLQLWHWRCSSRYFSLIMHPCCHVMCINSYIELLNGIQKAMHFNHFRYSLFFSCGQLVGLHANFFYEFKTKDIEVTHYATRLSLSWEARYAIYERIRRTKVRLIPKLYKKDCYEVKMIRSCRVDACTVFGKYFLECWWWKSTVFLLNSAHIWYAD